MEESDTASKIKPIIVEYCQSIFYNKKSVDYQKNSVIMDLKQNFVKNLNY